MSYLLSALGGNVNGAIITFGKVEQCVQWLLKRLHLSGVREDSMQEIIKVSVSNDVTSDLKDDESSHTFSNSAKSQNLSLIMFPKIWVMPNVQT